MSIQQPDNYISRIRTGYKKGSKIILIRSCDNKITRVIESKIRERFKREFLAHSDGHEHFIGDFNHMVKIINEIMDNSLN
jgi:hypothetical protein